VNAAVDPRPEERPMPPALRRRAPTARLAALARTALLALAAAWQAAAATPLTLATSATPTAAPVLVAEAQGYFRAEGLEVKVRRCPVGRVCLKWLLDGEVQFAAAADLGLTVAAFSDRPFGIVASIAEAGRSVRIVARADRAVRQAADLRGRRVGVLVGTNAHYFTDTLLQLGGLAPAEVRLLPLDATDPLGPLLRGEVDAAGLFEPHAQAAIDALGGNAVVLPTPAYLGSTFSVVAAPPPGGATDEQVTRLLRALQHAVAFIAAEPQRARAIVAPQVGLDVRQLEPAWTRLRFGVELEQSLLTTFETQARWARRNGLVPAAAPLPNYLDHVREAPLHQLDPAAVRLVR
jgi:ABC-type nitrate/sulfonate/bicarbonate transport system substrate-binding protein